MVDVGGLHKAYGADNREKRRREDDLRDAEVRESAFGNAIVQERLSMKGQKHEWCERAKTTVTGQEKRTRAQGAVGKSSSGSAENQRTRV